MAEQFERLQTALAGRYTVEHELGEGGMATVYLAHDVRHDRKVALKVLRPELAAVIGHQRFLEEIRVTANFHHPNIVQLYDSGEADGVLYYVMPMVEGESLRDRLDRENQLSIDEAVRIARAVAAALDYAHRRNVLHRDIKPDNIMLHEGNPLVADFGIALAVSRVGGERITDTGLSLGTPAYMSPEQATGDRALDARSDIYALGCVLYEMLAGDPPFFGSNVQAVIAKIVADKPVGLRSIRGTVPEPVAAAVDKALAKVPADRFATAQAFADALVAETPVTVTVPSARTTWLRRLGYAVPLAATAVLGWLLATSDGKPPAAEDTGGTIRRLTSFVGWEWSPSWSPDGSMITYSHIVGGSADVATLSTGGGDPHILTSDSPADEFNPRWSPDGSKIAYVSDRGTGTNLYWIPPTGGAERKVAEMHIPFLERMGAWAGSLGSNPWSPDGEELVFSRMGAADEVALWTVNLATGEQTQLTTPPPTVEDLSGSWSFDGATIAFMRVAAGRRQLLLVPATGGDPTLVMGDEPVWGQPAWFPDNRRLAFASARSGAFNLWSIDLDTRAIHRLTVGAGTDWEPTVASNGAIAYAWFDHQVDLYQAPADATPDTEHERLTSYTGQNFGARVSPSGDDVAYYSDRSGSFDLWLLHRPTGRQRPITEGPGNDRLLDWSPDGRDIVFLSDRDGAVRLWIVTVETGVVRQLSDHELPWSTHAAEGQGGPRWAPDGGHIGYLAPAQRGTALWVIASDGSGRRATDIYGALSFTWYRDGQRVLYTRRATDGSGRLELRAAHLRTGEDVLLRAGAIAEVDAARNGSAVSYLKAISHFTMDLYVLSLAAAGPDALPRPAGEPRQITFGEGQWHVHSGGWTPDGRAIVYSRDRDYGDIYVIEPDST